MASSAKPRPSLVDRVLGLPIATRILLAGSVALLALTASLVLVATHTVEDAMRAEMENEVVQAGNFHRYLVDQKGPPAIVGNKLVFGVWVANDDFSVVDFVKEKTGAEASIFQLVDGELVRVATTIQQLDGSGRGVGTKLIGPARAAFFRGESYTGLSPILGRDFVAHYDLLRDPAGQPIGYVLTAKPQTALEEATGRVERAVYSAALYALFICLVLLFVVIQPVGKAVRRVAAAAQNLALGDIDQTVRVRGRDEVGRMADAFRAMIGYQRRMAAAADAIARGDLDVDVRPQSAKDVLGNAFERMTASLRRVAEAADAIARGDLTAQVEPQSEKDVLGVAFRQMVVNLARHEAELAEGRRKLEESEARNRLIVDRALDAIVTMDERGVVTSWNPYAEEMFGWSAEEAIGRVLADTIVPPRYREAHTRGLAHFLATGEGPVLNQLIEISALHRDGHEFPIDLKMSAVRMEGGYRFNAFVRDITARKAAEDALREEQERSERLLLNILPPPIAERLKRDSAAIADGFADVTVLFADIVDFTSMSAEIPPAEVVALLNEIFSCFDELAEKHGLEKIKTIGDAYMVVGGLPEPRPDHAEAVADMALDIQRELEARFGDGGRPIRVRIGINTGPVVAGVIGTKKFIYDLWGDTVNTASRMEANGVPAGIQVTEATYERLRDRYDLVRRGTISVKGKGEMAAYLLLGRRTPPDPRVLAAANPSASP